jgi:hypothetical protein
MIEGLELLFPDGFFLDNITLFSPLILYYNLRVPGATAGPHYTKYSYLPLLLHVIVDFRQHHYKPTSIIRSKACLQ